MEKDDLTVKKCEVCGKRFYPPFPSLWAYKRDFRWYCSYKCMRQKTAKKRRTGPSPGNSYAVLALDARTGEVVGEWKKMSDVLACKELPSLGILRKCLNEGIEWNGRKYRYKDRAPKRDRKCENPVAKCVEMVDPDTGRVVAGYRSLAECERACKISDKTLRKKIQLGEVRNGFLFRLKADDVEE